MLSNFFPRSENYFLYNNILTIESGSLSVICQKLFKKLTDFEFLKNYLLPNCSTVINDRGPLPLTILCLQDMYHFYG